MEKTIFSLWSTGGLIADLVLLALLGFAIWRGVKKGFVYAVLWLAAIAVSAFAARFVTGLFAEPVSSFFYNKLEPSVIEASDRLTPELDRIDWTAFDFSDPEKKALTEEEFAYLQSNEGIVNLTALMTKVRVSESKQRETLYNIARSIHDSQESASDFIRGQATQAVRNAIVLLVKILMILLIFFLVLLLLRLLARGLNGLTNKVPLIGGLNRLLGGVLGLVICAVLVWLALYVWQQLWPDSYGKISDTSWLLQYAGRWNPLRQFFG